MVTRLNIRLLNSCRRIGKAVFLLYRKFRFLDKGEKALLIEHLLNQQGNGHDNRTMVRFRRYKNLLLQTNRQKGRLHSENNPYPEGHPRSYGECPRMYVLFAQFLNIWFHGKHPPLRGLYHNDSTRRNAFHEIWTLLSRTFLREVRACGCNRVPGTPFYDYTRNNAGGHIRRREKEMFSIE